MAWRQKQSSKIEHFGTVVRTIQRHKIQIQK
jgi:hypothetical protein